MLIVPKRGGKVVVLKQERGSGPQRVLALTQGKSLVRLSPQDFRGHLRKVATIELPRPFAPQSQSFQRATAETLRRLKISEAELPVDTDGDVEELQERIAAHPLHDAPGLDVALRAAWQADRIARDIARLERRVSSRNESLARQFDRVLGVLRTWGYVEDWTLTDAGRLLTRLNSEGELVVAEALREGRLDGIDPATMAAVVSCFTFQRRGPDNDEAMPPRRWPNQEVAKRSRALDGVWRDLHLAEREARLPETRRPDPGFTAAIYAWVRGDDLADVLEDEEMTGGDFVRNVKQTIDLLRQIGDVVPNQATAATARAAADACLRGVIAASSIVKAPAGVIRPGEEWGRPTSAAPDLEVAGGDADLAAAVRVSGILEGFLRRGGALVRFRPDASSDFAGAVGLGSRGLEPGRRRGARRPPAPRRTAGPRPT